jgi:hypothetical protein
LDQQLVNAEEPLPLADGEPFLANELVELR